MKGLTQEEAADGIISVSYLSKIENNQATPSKDVLELLFRRLGIRHGEGKTAASWRESVMDWYKTMVAREVQAAREKHETVRQLCQEGNDIEAAIYYQLMYVRYLLLLRDVKGAEAAARSVQEWYEALDDAMRYYYWKFFGLLYYCQEKYDDALQCCQKAERLSGSERRPGWEEADLAYLSALSYSRTWNVFSCLRHAERALALSQAEYDLRRSAECHILLAICYRRCGEIEKAIECCQLANKAAQLAGDRLLIGIVEHNLGHLKSMKKLYREAVQHYETSLMYKMDAPPADRFITLLALVREHYGAQNYRKALAAAEEGWKQLERTAGGAAGCYEYYLHFSVYRLLLSGEGEAFERLLKHEAIPYFQKRKEYEDAACYAEYLADYYARLRQYKQAAHYYRLGCDLLRQRERR